MMYLLNEGLASESPQCGIWLISLRKHDTGMQNSFPKQKINKGTTPNSHESIAYFKFNLFLKYKNARIEW